MSGRHLSVESGVSLCLLAKRLVSFAVLWALTLGALPLSPACGQSRFVKTGRDGLLQYRLDNRGDRLLDYSLSGYNHSKAEPPSALELINRQKSRIVTVKPSRGDDQQRIQEAIDRVSQFSPNAKGYRGIVQLTAGEFRVSGPLNINRSGVILRGVGSGSRDELYLMPGERLPVGRRAINLNKATVLRATTAIRGHVVFVQDPSISNARGFLHHSRTSQRVAITDKVVPAGAASFNVETTDPFKVGDRVNVFRQASQEWLDAVQGVNDQGERSLGWIVDNSNRFDQQQERRIVRIEGKRLFLDAPITHRIDSRTVSGEVYAYKDRRLENIAIEDIRCVADFDQTKTAKAGRGFDGDREYLKIFSDNDHAKDFIRLEEVRNAFVRNVAGQNLSGSTVDVGLLAKHVTIRDSLSLRPVSAISGGWRYGFSVQGQFILAQNLFSENGRHSFVINTTFGGYNRGPNVFLNCQAVGSFADSGPHQRFATGCLYDNVSDDYVLNAANAGMIGKDASGGGQGYRGANFVFFNCTAGSFRVVDVPDGHNYVIGGVETATDRSRTGAAGTIDSPGVRIDFNDRENPLNSLFVAQRLQRDRYPRIESREYTVGDYDEFEFDPGVDDDLSGVDPALRAALDRQRGRYGELPVVGFDGDRTGRRIPFTFNYDLAAGEKVISAVLTIATRSQDSDRSHDALFLENRSEPLSFKKLDFQKLDTVEFDDGVQVSTITIFGNINFLQDGRYNGVVASNRSVDFVSLVLNVATPGRE